MFSWKTAKYSAIIAAAAPCYCRSEDCKVIWAIWWWFWCLSCRWSHNSLPFCSRLCGLLVFFERQTWLLVPKPAHDAIKGWQMLLQTPKTGQNGAADGFLPHFRSEILKKDWLKLHLLLLIWLKVKNTTCIYNLTGIFSQFVGKMS